MSRQPKILHLIETLTTALTALKEALQQEPEIMTAMLSRPVTRGRPQKYTAENTKHWGFGEKPDIIISREQKVAVATAKSVRNRLGIAPVAAPESRSAKQAIWKTWNWELNDSQLATEHGISRERSRQIRAQLGLPARRQINSEKTNVRFDQFKVWIADRKEIPLLEAKQQGFNCLSIHKWCRKLRVGLKRKFRTQDRTHWKLVNWHLPNWMIEEAWGTPYNTSATKRSVLGKPHGPRGIFRKNPPPDFVAAFEQEKAKAKKFKLEHAR